MIKTICYGTERHWRERGDAVRWFLECMGASDGAEKARYADILEQLLCGAELATDGSEITSKCVDLNAKV